MPFFCFVLGGRPFFSHLKLSTLLVTEAGRCERDRVKVCLNVLQNTFILGSGKSRELMLEIVSEAPLVLPKSQQIRQVQVLTVIVHDRSKCMSQRSSQAW